VKPETVLGWRRRADDSWDLWLDPRTKIAYVRITSFDGTIPAFKAVMADLTRQGMTALVLDLRFNTGWRFGEAIDVSDLFIDDEVIVTVRGRVWKDHALRGKRPGSLLKFPMVCLINGDSADCSEVVAACLQDHKRALIVGERSKGKAAFQHWNHPNDLGYELGYTTLICYRPSGAKLDRRRLPGSPADEWGVTPSPGLTVTLSEAERDRLRQDLEEAAYLYPRGRARPVAAPDRQRDFALALLRKQLKVPAP
jgi:carboxyl-terminal processing protease